MVSLPAATRINASSASLDADFSSGSRSLSRNSSKIVRCVDLEDFAVSTSAFEKVAVILRYTAYSHLNLALAIAKL